MRNVKVQLWDGEKYLPGNVRGEIFQGFSIHRSLVPKCKLIIVTNEDGCSVRKKFKNYAEARSFIRIIRRKLSAEDLALTLKSSREELLEDKESKKRIGLVVLEAERKVKAARKKAAHA